MLEPRVKVEDQVSPLPGMNHPSPDTGISGCGLGDVREKVSEKLENFQEYLSNIWKEGKNIAWVLWAEGKIFFSILAVVSILALLYFILVFLGSIAASYMAIKDCLGSCLCRASVPDDIEMEETRKSHAE